MLFCLLVAAFPTAAQQTSRISLRDNISGDPVSFAHVLVESLDPDDKSSKGYLTDEKGVATIQINSTSKISTTFVGYKTRFDTIQPGESMEIDMEPTVYNVDEVVVTAQYRPETVDKSIYRIKVINSQVIEQKAALNLNEMLAGELNIRSTHDNALGSSITMQGLEGEHVKYLIDGVPVIGRQNGNIDLNQINMNNVDHIETIQGPMSVVYGSNALAGVINIITKKSNRYPLTVYADGYYESVGLYDFSLGGSYSKKKNSFSLNANRYFFDGYSPDQSDTTRWKQWKPKLQWNLDASYMYSSTKTMIKITGTYFYEKLQDKGNPLEAFNYDKAFDKYHITNRGVVRGEWNQTFNPRSRLNVMSAYSAYSKIKNTYLKDLTNLDEILVVQDDAQDTTLFDNILFRTEYNHILKSDFFAYQIGFNLNHESAYGKRIKDNSQSIGDYAAFLSMNFTPAPVISIQPGLRVIYNTNYSAPLVYSLNVKWNITEPLIMRVSAAKGFRAPSLKELYLNFDDVNHTIFGNPDLEAESSRNYNFSLNYNRQTAAAYNWGIDFGLFYNHIQNKIELKQISSDPLWYSYINVDQFYTQGFEIMFNNRIYPWLKLNIGYSYTGRKQVDSEIVNNPGFIYSSDFNVQLNYWWRLPDINFSVFYKYNGDYPNLAVNDNEETVVVTMEAYNSLDMNMNRWFWKRRINLQIGAKNLFDNTDVNVNGSGSSNGAHSGGGGSVPVNWGRSYFVKVQFKFNQ